MKNFWGIRYFLRLTGVHGHFSLSACLISMSLSNSRLPVTAQRRPHERHNTSSMGKGEGFFFFFPQQGERKLCSRTRRRRKASREWAWPRTHPASSFASEIVRRRLSLECEKKKKNITLLLLEDLKKHTHCAMMNARELARPAAALIPELKSGRSLPGGAQSQLGESAARACLPRKLQMNVRTSVGDNKSLPETDYSGKHCK